MPAGRREGGREEQRERERDGGEKEGERESRREGHPGGLSTRQLPQRLKPGRQTSREGTVVGEESRERTGQCLEHRINGTW